MTVADAMRKVLCEVFVQLAVDKVAWLDDFRAFLRDIPFRRVLVGDCDDDWIKYADEEPRQKTRWEFRRSIIIEREGLAPSVREYPVFEMEVEFVPAGESFERRAEVILLDLRPSVVTYRVWEGGDGNPITVKIGHELRYDGVYVPSLYTTGRWIDGFEEAEPKYHYAVVDDVAFVLRRIEEGGNRR